MSSLRTLPSLWIIIFVIFICYNPPKGNALKCYVCNSAFYYNCEMPSSTFLMECATNMTAGITAVKGAVGNNANFTFTSCRKQTVVIPEYHNGNGSAKLTSTRIVRTCGWIDNPEKDICELTSSKGILNTHCVCLHDRCNHGNKNFVGSILLLILLCSSFIIAETIFA